MIFVFFIVWRIAAILVAIVAQKIIPYLGFFPLKEIVPGFHVPLLISAFANFDGLHYLMIAQRGYSQYEQAFFPLYPTLIHLLSLITYNELISGLLISNISFVSALFVFQKILVLLKIDKKQISWFFIFFLCFTSSFFFGAAYTEGLFFLLFSLSIYFFLKKNYALAGFFATLTSLTRLIGIFLFIPFFFQLIAEKGGVLKNFKFQVSNLCVALFSPLLGLFIYMAYLWKTTGDPLIFFHAQPKFGANRSTHLILLPQVLYRYCKILVTAAHDFQWSMALVEVTIFLIVFCILIADLVVLLKEKKQNYFLIGLTVFSFANIILPTLTGTFSSIPRYALFSFSFFLFLAKIKSSGIKTAIAIILTLSQVVLLGLFIQGYFVG